MPRTSIRLDYFEKELLDKFTNEGYSKKAIFSTGLTLAWELLEKKRRLVPVNRDKRMIISERPESVEISHEAHSSLTKIIEQLNVNKATALSFALRTLDKYVSKKGSSVLDNYQPEVKQQQGKVYIKKWVKLEEEAYNELVIKARKLGVSVDKLMDEAVKIALRMTSLDV
jgi:thiamine pyrophosphate-dependent acetolactate synthase large subunit-like protein